MSDNRLRWIALGLLAILGPVVLFYPFATLVGWLVVTVFS